MSESNEIIVALNCENTKKGSLNENSTNKENLLKKKKNIRVKKKDRKSDPVVVNGLTQWMSNSLVIISPEKTVKNNIIDVEGGDTKSLDANEQFSHSVNEELNKNLNIEAESVDVSIVISEETPNIVRSKKRFPNLTLSANNKGKPKIKECSQQGNLNGFIKITSPVKSKVEELVQECCDDEDRLRVSVKLFSPRRNKKTKNNKKTQLLNSEQREDSFQDINTLVIINDNSNNNEGIEAREKTSNLKDSDTKNPECNLSDKNAIKSKETMKCQNENVSKRRGRKKGIKGKLSLTRELNDKNDKQNENNLISPVISEADKTRTSKDDHEEFQEVKEQSAADEFLKQVQPSSLMSNKKGKKQEKIKSSMMEKAGKTAVNAKNSKKESKTKRINRDKKEVNISKTELENGIKEISKKKIIESAKNESKETSTKLMKDKKEKGDKMIKDNKEKIKVGPSKIKDKTFKMKKSSKFNKKTKTQKFEEKSFSKQETSVGNKTSNFNTTDILNPKMSPKEIIEVQSIDLRRTPTSPQKNVFQFMMNNRNKSIGQNLDGKISESSAEKDLTSDKGKKERLNKRKEQFKEWNKSKGGTKRKLDEKVREKYTHKVLQSRAKRMKEMLEIDSDSSNSDDFTPKRIKRRKRVFSSESSCESSNDVLIPLQPEIVKNSIIIEDTNDGDEFKKKNKIKIHAQKGLLSFFGVLKNEEPKNEAIVLSDNDNEISAQESKPKIKTFASQDSKGEKSVSKVFTGSSSDSTINSRKKSLRVRKVSGSDSENISIAELRQRLTMKINLNNMEIIESSLDEHSDNADKISKRKKKRCISESDDDVILVDNVFVKKKVPTVFLKAAGKPKMDPKALEARKSFLQSGIPSSLRKAIEKQKNTEDIEFNIFPEISHVLQKPTDSSIWNLPEVHLTFIKSEERSVPQIGDWKYGSVTTCTSKVPEYKMNLKPPVKNQNFIAEIIKLKEKHPEFPVYKIFRTLREKCGCKPLTPKRSTSIGPNKRGRKRKNADKSLEIIEPEPVEVNQIEFSMWTEKYKPQSSDNIIGNRRSIQNLKSWLENWMEFSMEINNAKQRHRSESSDFESIGEHSNSRSISLPENCMILSGPPGSGKTSAVYAICQELGINVIELNASSKRTGKRLIQELQEATQSHQVRKKETNSLSSFLQKPKDKKPTENSTNAKMCLLLIEDVDIVFDQDEGFLSTLRELLLTTKRPFVLTTTDIRSEHLEKFVEQYPVINFAPLSAKILSIWLQIMCIVEGLLVDESALCDLLEWNKGDMRKTILQLQFWGTSGGNINHSIESSPKISSSIKLKGKCADEDESFLQKEFSNAKSTQRIDLHTDCINSFLAHESGSFLSYPLNLGVLWWNIPDIMDLKEDETDKSELIKLKSMTNFYDALSLSDTMLNTESRYGDFEPCGNRWQAKLKDTLSSKERMMTFSDDFMENLTHTLIDGFCKIHKTEIAKINPNVPNKEDLRWRNKRFDCEEIYLQAISPMYANNHYAFSADYFSTLRTITRVEMEREINNSKRNNRFFNYLKTLNIDPDRDTLETASSMFNVLS